VSRNRPDLNNNGRGVNRPQLREPGVSRDLPHLSNDGRGVNHPRLRELGVLRDRPHLVSDGQGVNRPQLREPGVLRDRPHLSNDGRGVNRPQLREPGVLRDRPHLSNNGQGVNHAGLRELGAGEEEFHPRIMPELCRWMAWLSARLRHVRIVNGEWSRVCTDGVLKTLPVRQGGVAGVFLDPPYDTGERAKGLYGHDAHGIADTVRSWCAAHGDDPRLRIVLAGFDTEHVDLEARGWTVHEWFANGYLTGGMGDQQHRERMWASPACLGIAEPTAQISMDFGDCNFPAARSAQEGHRKPLLTSSANSNADRPQKQNSERRFT
jgi:hypothetical protein